MPAQGLLVYGIAPSRGAIRALRPHRRVHNLGRYTQEHAISGRKGRGMRAPALRLMLPRHASSRQFRPRVRGIGLLGVVLTLGCVALLAGLIIPAFFGRHTVTLDNAALLLARDLRAVQNRAAHTGQKTQLR